MAALAGGIMAVLLQFQTDGEPIMVDVSPPGSKVSAVGVMDTALKQAEQSFDKALRTAGAVAQSFQKVVDEFQLKTAELELGFQFTAKGTIYLVQSETQAALKVKVTFEPSANATTGSASSPQT
jgi:hypothetical protein